MATLPIEIGGVRIERAPNVIATHLSPVLIEALQSCIRKDLVPGYIVRSIWISSANDSHQLPSRHAMGKAVDISRINGHFIQLAYTSDAYIRAVVDEIQTCFEKFPQRRENFGPKLKLKLGQPFLVGGHDDHIHLSVN